ncbi:hypothetical protein [Marilutibacter alkalisoli]|uniref:Uncharacterized protein n=1 Tax=Marilutibacter alkalisoli TaxID=2591633 RepID=A0A514BVP0_9GAMM|nr:hypothetical protein [Lysobacter alkalisoli]QDH71464.1 hypothetical protein FKV23_16220 [Lysobacter alkalisoli]
MSHTLGMPSGSRSITVLPIELVSTMPSSAPKAMFSMRTECASRVMREHAAIEVDEVLDELRIDACVPRCDVPP